MRTGAVRRGVIAALVVALALVTPVRVAAEPIVYRFSLDYSGTCEGFTEGEIRVDGSTVELWGGEAGSLAKVGSALRQPDDTFSLSVSGAGFTMNGTLKGMSVSGTGRYSAAGSDCPFTFEGYATGDYEEERDEVVDSEPEEFDPTSDKPLSVGEVRTILRRVGFDQGKIEEFLKGNRSGLIHGVPLDSKRAINFNIDVFHLLANTETRSGRPTFPVLVAMTQNSECYDADSDYCGSLHTLLVQRAYVDPAAAVALNRTLRLAITMGLPAEQEGGPA